MSESSPVLIPRSAIRAAIAPFIASAVLMAVSWFATGSSLGLFLAGLFLAVVLVPPIVLLRDETISRIILTIAVADGIGLVWLIALFTGAISLIQWIATYLIIVAWSISLAGSVSLLARLRVHPIFASAITVVTGWLWLTWPVWLSPALRESGNQSLINTLVQLSPPLAMNGVLIHFGAWSQAAIAYHLTDLGQHIEYALPAHGVTCIAAHLLLGVALLFAGHTKRVSAPADAIHV